MQPSEIIKLHIRHGAVLKNILCGWLSRQPNWDDAFRDPVHAIYAWWPRGDYQEQQTVGEKIESRATNHERFLREEMSAFKDEMRRNLVEPGLSDSRRTKTLKTAPRDR